MKDFRVRSCRNGTEDAVIFKLAFYDKKCILGSIMPQEFNKNLKECSKNIRNGLFLHTAPISPTSILEFFGLSTRYFGILSVRGGGPPTSRVRMGGVFSHSWPGMQKLAGSDHTWV